MAIPVESSCIEMHIVDEKQGSVRHLANQLLHLSFADSQKILLDWVSSPTLPHDFLQSQHSTCLASVRKQTGIVSLSLPNLPILSREPKFQSIIGIPISKNFLKAGLVTGFSSVSLPEIAGSAS